MFMTNMRPKADILTGPGRRPRWTAAAMWQVGIIALVLALGGCAATMQPHETALLQQSRYSELRQYMETRVNSSVKDTTHNLFYLCFAYAKVRQYDQLFPCLDRLQRNIDRGDIKIYWFDFSASPVLMRAQAMIELGDYPRAVEYAKSAIRLTQGDDTYLQMRIYALTAAGLAHAFNGDPTAASGFADQLEKVSADPVTSSDQYIGLARIYMALGDYARALGAIHRDDQGAAFRGLVDLITGASLAGESIFTYWQLPKEYIRSRALFETGNIGGAKKGYDELLAKAGTRQSADLYWLILFDRGVIAEREGARSEAIGLYESAVASIETQRASIPSEGNKIGFVGDKQQVYLRLVSALIAEGQIARAFDYAEQAKARAMVDLLANRQRFAVRGQSSADTASLLDELAKIEAASRVEDVAKQPAEREQERMRSVAVIEQLRRKAPELASLVSVNTARASEVRNQMRPDETLVEYFGDEKSFFAFVLGRDQIQVVSLDGRGLTDSVRRLRGEIQNPRSQTFLTEANSLHRRLIVPIRRFTNDRLVIVPHGPLHYLPFAALHDGRKYLIEDVTFRLLPSASVARYLARSAKPPSPKLLVFGNPALGDRRYDLPGAEAEARAISSLWPDAKVLLRGQASKDAIRGMGAQYSYIHFATHGQFDAAKPLVSGLLLAGDPSGNGRLTVGELYELSLSADLVTMSACETAMGKITNGDDVVGLTRGFLYAGARAIVATLWPIIDQETMFLMTEFYRNLKTMGKAAALRQAQLAALRKYPHPFYWAAFQITGDGS